MHTCVCARGSMHVCTLYFSLRLSVFVLLYICVLHHLLHVCMGFSVDVFCVVFWCLDVSLHVFVSLCACISVCNCDKLSLGVSLGVWVLRVCIHVTWILSLFASSLFVRGWKQTIRFQAWGEWWAWTIMASGSHPCDVSEAWSAGSLRTAPTLRSVQPCAENTLTGQNYLFWNQCLFSFCC